MRNTIKDRTINFTPGTRSGRAPNPVLINRATADIKALSIAASECCDAYLTMLAKWATTPEREAAASKLPLELFQVNTVGLSDDEAEAQEVAHAERFRNIYRYSFGDKAPSHRTYVRREVREEWLLFVSIFVLVHPEKAKAWFDPERELQMSRATTERTLRAHGRKSLSGHARTSHSRRPTSAPKTVAHLKSAMEE